MRSNSIGTRSSLIGNFRDTFWSHYICSTGMIECENLEISNYEKYVPVYNPYSLSQFKSLINNYYGAGMVEIFEEVNKLNGAHINLIESDDFANMLGRE